MSKIINIQGQKFGRLSVIDYVGIKNRTAFWKCLCECGNVVEVAGYKLRSGHTKSCGCYSRERIKNLNYKTGKTKSKIYYAYRNMLNRCNNPKADMFYLYGERGIKVCNEWQDKEHGFENFLSWSESHGYEEGLSIDRINNDKGYSPDNCRWVSKLEQANNKRTNKYLRINGIVDTVGNHSRRFNVSYWNLLHYAKGGRNTMYPDLIIEVVSDGV